jgi:hypothetical protein
VINYLKSVIFYCQHPKYQVTNGRVRYWHIYKQKCFPHGCVTQDIQRIAPALTITEREYQDFLKEFKVFHKWAAARSSKLRNSFIGVVQQVVPRFEVALVEGTLFYNLEGFTLLYKECLIDNTFFEDYVYVFIDKATQDEMNFHDEDTVSGVGHFHMDNRGLVTIRMPSKLKTIIPGKPHNYWNAQTISQISLRYVNYLHQDKCMKCPWALIATEWHSRSRSHQNHLCCTVKECRMTENWE